ncbi:hypothetical protein X808_870 [Mannheimia varigena USDA-ARS-USMARC-1296]|uniref:Uncharacterized protein n=1 Tax=Mannheimia varigena USDA-ARS-USMARC-1296 TaxID=1433287 RepID=W0Q6S6_9PAST|nr:hypothetical protein X808_870 [Mannheimia varigena USDA-ARS-USMARC-1296]
MGLVEPQRGSDKVTSDGSCEVQAVKFCKKFTKSHRLSLIGECYEIDPKTSFSSCHFDDFVQ